MKDNKLIAEFMNVETISGVRPPIHRGNKGEEVLDYLPFPDGNRYEVHELSYDVSWDWLMPVVEKIESFTDENRCCKYNVNMEQSWVEIIDNQTSDEIVSVDGDDKILATYKAVVEFIQYYQKKT